MTNPDMENSEKVLKYSGLGNMPRTRRGHMSLTAACCLTKIHFCKLRYYILRRRRDNLLHNPLHDGLLSYNRSRTTVTLRAYFMLQKDPTFRAQNDQFRANNDWVKLVEGSYYIEDFKIGLSSVCFVRRKIFDFES